jgi:hypothetical protein
MMENSARLAFEMSLRFLLLLDVAEDQALSDYKLCALDFISTYAADYGFSDTNLNGNGSYRFSEFANRKYLTKDAIGNLVTRGLLSISSSKDGAEYTLSESGKSAVQVLHSDYANNYWHTAYKVFRNIGSMTGQQLCNLIKDHAIDSLAEGGAHA